MGIKGLWKKVTSDYEREHWNFEQELIPNKTVLLVDATGFIFHLLDTQLLTLYTDVKFKREFGGNYNEIESLFTREIQRLISLGIELIFYLDGPDSYYKGNTTAKRREQLLEQWGNMFYSSLGDGSALTSQDDLPLPAMSSPTLLHVLDRLKIRFVKSRVEADQEMALACYNSNRSSGGNKRFYCYTADR